MRPVALLTDFGRTDHYVGVMHAVLVREAPGVERIDLGHDVPPGDIWAASFVLRCAWPHLPASGVVLAVVDPGVGTDRRALAVQVGERWLVAPDNGLAAAPGTPEQVIELEWETMGLSPPSATFHGRDLFAPAAARLGRGEPVTSLGKPTAVDNLVLCPLPAPVATANGWRVTILRVDHFGNVVTNLQASTIPAHSIVRSASMGQVRRVATYGQAPPGEVVAVEGSSGHLELAVNQGSAADALGLERGDAFELSVHALPQRFGLNCCP